MLAAIMNDPIWQAVAQIVRDSTDISCDSFETSPVYGGDINKAWCLSCGNERFFVKTNRSDMLFMFEAEQAGLQEIARSQSIRVPAVFGCGFGGVLSFIVMEFLELGRDADEALFAQQLASMHNHSLNQFGFHIDNTIGSTPQYNNYMDDWVEFWQIHRLGFQLELAKKNQLDKEMIHRGEILNEVVGRFFCYYQPKASLLHGDLWSGNQGADSESNPVIFDPACYYGDHEADLAMMELFGQPGAGFFDAYNEVFAIDPGYAVRRDLYNLYHILNHANLFGGGYATSAQRLIDKLLAEV